MCDVDQKKKKKLIGVHVSFFAITKNPHGEKDELRCSLLKYKFFPSLIRGHKFKDSIQ